MSNSFLFVTGLIISITGSAHAFVDTKVEGKYTVPVAAELAAFASFPVEVELSKQGEATRVQYTLPEELVGEKMKFELVKNDKGEWAGDQVDTDCTRTPDRFNCRLAFRKMAVDLARVESAINKRFTDPKERAGRLMVARSFSTEPLGVIEYVITAETSQYGK